MAAGTIDFGQLETSPEISNAAMKVRTPMEPIEEKLRAFIADAILFSRDGFNYPDDASFLETGIVDSMSIMEIVLFAQETFGVEIADREIVPDNFDSVEKIAAYLRRKIAGGQGPKQ